MTLKCFNISTKQGVKIGDDKADNRIIMSKEKKKKKTH